MVWRHVYDDDKVTTELELVAMLPDGSYDWSLGRALLKAEKFYANGVRGYYAEDTRLVFHAKLDQADLAEVQKSFTAVLGELANLRKKLRIIQEAG